MQEQKQVRSPKIHPKNTKPSIVGSDHTRYPPYCALATHPPATLTTTSSMRASTTLRHKLVRVHESLRISQVAALFEQLQLSISPRLPAQTPDIAETSSTVSCVEFGEGAAAPTAGQGCNAHC
eukprot:COSAG06_NODE_2539_length_6706_cov_100.378084_3_plen_123_part_00